MDWLASKHTMQLFDTCHDPQEAYKRIQALEEICKEQTELITSQREAVSSRDDRIERLERQCYMFSQRVDGDDKKIGQLESENAGLRQHILDLQAEAA